MKTATFGSVTEHGRTAKHCACIHAGTERIVEISPYAPWQPHVTAVVKALLGITDPRPVAGLSYVRVRGA